MAKWKARTDVNLDREIDAARSRSQIVSGEGPRALGARYDPATQRIDIELADGCLFAIPVSQIQGLDGASPAELERVEVAGEGYALHWDGLDVHFTVAGLLAGRLGSQLWMRQHAQRAGSVRSKAKAAAARRNGMKGGRPKGSGRKGKSG
jgi:hypothetical protein